MDDSSGHLDYGVFFEEVRVIEHGVFGDETDGIYHSAVAEDFLEGGCEEGTCFFDFCHIQRSHHLFTMCFDFENRI